MKTPLLSQACSAIHVRLKIYLFILFGCSVTLGIAQNPDNLSNQTPKKALWSERANTKLANFYQIQQDFNQYWEGKKAAKGQGYKVFKRWETFMAPRVYPSGDMALPSMTYNNYINWQENYSNRPPKEKLAASSIANWTELGPLSKPSGYDAGVGRIDFVRFDPTNSNTIYVGAPDGGLWKSTNGGTNWTTNTDFLTVIGCADLAIDPTNTQNMYLATGNWEFDRRSIGILKSTDGGATWNTTSLVWTALDNYKIRKLLMHPSNPLIMMIATDGGIFRTTDGWATYTMIASPGVTSFYDMEFKPGDPNTVYAVGTDFWKSIDNGVTWTQITTGLPAAASVSRAVLGVTAANAAYVYILMGNASSEYLGTYRSTDSGASFSLQSSQTVPAATPTPNILNASKDGTGTGGQAGHDLAIAISPVDADLVTIGGISQWRSTNGGVNWTLLSYWLGTDTNYPGDGDGPPDYVHADIQDIVYLPGSSTTMFATCDGGISKSTNNGLNWTDISNDLRVAQQSNIALSAATSGLMIAGLQDIGTLLNNGGSWSVINGGDGESAFIDRTNDMNMVTSNPNGAHALSTDGGATKSDITGLPPGLLFFSPIIQDPVTATKVYAGGRNELYVSTDFTATWTALGTPFGTGGIVQFVVAPSNPAVIYAIKFDAISKSTDSGLNWTNVTSTLPVGAAALMNLAVSNTDPNKVWVVFSGYSAGDKVFKTVDGGSSWANVSAGLPNIPINAIVYKNGTANDEVYIGADIGVYYLDNTLAAVVPFFTDLPRCAVTDLEIFYPTGKLRASTYGRGAWESDLYVAATPEVNLSVSTNSGTEAGTTVVTVTVTASAAVSGPQTVSLAVTGTGITAGDFNLSNTTITIPDGLTIGTVTFTIVNDVLVEGPETATLTISGPSAGIVLGTTLSQNIAITDDDACPVTTITVTENSGTAANDGTTCPGATVTLATSGGGTYAWSTGASTSSINVAPNITTTYTVTVTNNSCVGSATQIITVNPLPTPSITAVESSGTENNDGTTCAGATVALSTSGGGTYLWSTGATTSTINVAPTITTGYSVTVTNANGCSGTATTTITVNPLPTPSITVTENSGTASNDGTTCAGASVTLSTVEIGAYLWSTGATTSTINVAPVITTTYTLTVTNSNGCAGVASTIITVNPASTPAISATETSGTTNNDGTTCAGATVTLATSGGGTYAWSTGATTSSIDVAPAITTIYNVTVTNAGCSGMASRTITVNPLPTPTITVGENSGIESNDGTTCAGALVVLSTSGGGTYLWSTGATTSSINVAPTITTGYSVTVTNANACSGSATTTITVNPLPTPSITVTENSGTPNDGTICSSTSVNLATSGGGTYAWSTGATTSAINVAPAITTTYTVTVTNGNGCSNTASQTIVVNPLVNASLSKNVDTICTGGQVTFTFHESVYPPGTEFTVTADLTDDNGTNPVTIADLINGEQFVFTEGIQFTGTGTATFSNIKAVLEVGACEDTISGFSIVVVNCEVSIKDPCVCLNNSPVRDNGTYGNVGTFRDTVEVRALVGQTWSVTSVTGLYEDAAGTDPVDLNDLLPELSPGIYKLQGYHVDSVGYTISVSDGRGNTLSIGNKCYYPDPVFTGLPLFVSPAAPAFNVTGTVANNATGTGTFILNGVPQAGAGSAPTVLSINPALLPLGENTLVYEFDADTAGSQNLSDPGCVQEVRQIFSVVEEKCACLNLNITLDANCQFLLLPSQVSSNCVTGTVRVMDNIPGNAGLIDCAGVWTYGLFDANGNIICWGKVTAEDKTAPALVCAPADFTLDCYDVNYVLNNRLTIGNVGATSSPRPAATSSQTINNAEGVAGTGDNCQLGLIPPGLVSDNIKNLGYAYFRDNCFTCGCRVTLKWSDKVVFYNCDQMAANGGIYATISREWVATDCNGMSTAYVQKINFTRPDIDDFVFNGPGEGKYDRVVEYNSCTPDKSLIKKADVTPYICSYFNTSANPRCLYLDEVECNYSISIKDTEFPICGGKGVKIDRELYVFDWCAGGIVDTFHILIKIGDFTAPTCEYAHGAPYDISTGPMDCTAAIPVTVA
ncbi:hypothetical protein, partial [Haliscomenobacter sp.]|uniref:hypothetical protein n=1 Tax=Haliscomenobacter sp. TaxID=2717303 RepID=UPI0035937E90